MLKLLSSFILMMAVCSPAWSATQLKKTVCLSGCDYTSLEACMHANEQNLVTADKYFDVEISGYWSSADTTAVTVHNYTTDATRYINIYTTGSARHDGTAYKSGAHKLSVSLTSSGTGATAFLLQSHYVTVDGIVIAVAFHAPFTAYQVGFHFGSTNETKLKNSIIYATTTSHTDPIGIEVWSGDNGRTQYVYNNIIYNIPNTARGGIWIYLEPSRSSTFYVYNNTVFGCGVGIYTAKGSSATFNLYLKNNIAIGNTTDFSFVSAPLSNDYNASSDATATGANSLNSGTASKPSTSDFVSVSAGSENFNLTSSSVELDKGADLGTSYNTDIIGTSRPQGSAWDIGAFEYVSSGPANTYSIIRNSIIRNSIIR